VYQTVGHDAIHYYAECMGLPLLRREIIGTPRRQEMDYEETIDDETEDLYALLSQVKVITCRNSNGFMA
jgi:diphthine-ammonia ligase